MDTNSADRRGMADVVQVSRCHKQQAVGRRYKVANLSRSLRDSLNVGPAVLHIPQKPLRQLSRPFHRQSHVGETTAVSIGFGDVLG